MRRFLFTIWVIVQMYLCCPGLKAVAQVPVIINDTSKQHIFHYKEIFCLKDPSCKLTLNQVNSPAFFNKFKASQDATPVTLDLNAAYWYRINIRTNPHSTNNWMLEFFDQTIDSITVYSPNQTGNYVVTNLGSSRPFFKRIYQHKNFSLNINNTFDGVRTYFVRIKSHEAAKRYYSAAFDKLVY